MQTASRTRLRRTIRLAPINRGVTAMIFGRYARKDGIKEFLARVQAFTKLMTRYGVPVSREVTDLFQAAMAKVEAAVPFHLCPRCMGEGPSDCNCKGRGYFDRTQEREYAIAAHRGKRKEAGDNRTINRVLIDARKLAKRGRAKDDTDAVADELMQEAFNE